MDKLDITPRTSHKRTIRNIDVKRYMGHWYEIARYENIFEQGLVDVDTFYTLLPDKSIKVINRGVSPLGKIRSMIGSAYQPNSQTPGHLRVSFFWWFYSDYNIIMLDKDYSYSVVSGKHGQYLWILAREKTLPGKTLDYIFNFLRARGYNPSKLVFN